MLKSQKAACAVASVAALFEIPRFKSRLRCDPNAWTCERLVNVPPLAIRLYAYGTDRIHRKAVKSSMPHAKPGVTKYKIQNTK